jgi:glc operon protein GlcG
MRRHLMLTTALIGLVTAAPAGAFELAMAKKMADGCEAKAGQEGWKMNIAVVDDGANLVLFRRMDGAFLGSGQIAKMKAQSSAKLPFPTRAIGEIAFGKDGKPGTTPGLALVPGIIAFPGGLPIKRADGTLLGAIGVSGGSADQDEMCSQAGLDTVADQLK